MLQPPSSPKIGVFFFNLPFLRNIDVEQKAKHRIRKKTKIRKGDWNEKEERKPTKMRKD